MPTIQHNPITILLEKVISTYVQAVLALLLVSGLTGLDVSAAKAMAVAALPAALTVLANGLQTVELGKLPFWVDLVFRLFRTYAAAFIGVLVALPVFSLAPEALGSAQTAAVAAVLALVKGYAASFVGDTTPALLPSAGGS